MEHRLKCETVKLSFTAVFISSHTKPSKSFSDTYAEYS